LKTHATIASLVACQSNLNAPTPGTLKTPVIVASKTSAVVASGLLTLEPEETLDVVATGLLSLEWNSMTPAGAASVLLTLEPEDFCCCSFCTPDAGT
jgi:hypothetical protein